MAVALVDKGARLRVNDAIDVVVLEIYNGSVKIGLVERSPAATAQDACRLASARNVVSPAGRDLAATGSTAHQVPPGRRDLPQELLPHTKENAPGVAAHASEGVSSLPRTPEALRR